MGDMDDIKKFINLQKALVQERATIQARLQQINQALSGSSGPAASAVAKKRGRPKGVKRGKRTMSAEARARIAEAQKKRWAKAKSKKTAKK